MPSYYKWTTFKKTMRNRNDYPSLKVSTHPLKVEIMSMKQSKTFIESVNKWSAAFEEIDPLMKFEKMNVDEDVGPTTDGDMSTDYTKSWSKRKTHILSKFTTGEKLTIVSSFLPGGEKALIRQVSNLNEKVKHRLEQLDDFDEGSIRKTMGLSQQEFITKINMLDDEITKAWDSEQRVKAFKICIQCSKLLSDVNVMQFYPSKFILINDILDNFGDLVFRRLQKKSCGVDVQSPLDIDSSLVPETAKETCQNWMFKMASIRELLPRLYMEMSLLKCYVFINKDEITSAIKRLTTMIRGIGNPLVAIYLRVYLCIVASKLLGKQSEQFFHQNLREFLDEYQQIFHPMMKKKYETQLLTLDQYLNLYEPAVNWLMLGALNHHNSKPALLKVFLDQCDNMENNELLLACIVSSFDSESIIEHSARILESIQKSAEKMVLLSHVLGSLGEHLCNAGNYRRLPSESLSQTWWKIASNIRSTVNFLQVLEPWLQFACTRLSTQHTNIILRGTIRFLLKGGKPAEEFSSNFHLVIRRMLKSIPDVEELFLMDAFMPLLELVQTSNARTAIAKTVLSIFFERYSAVHVDDPILISSLMRLCCILHDAITAVTVEDESKACADLIIKYVYAVKHQDDFEQQLNFYVECRSAFIKLDAVLVALVHAVNALACRASRERERWLQRACAAYCFVTVPSLRCPSARAHLYLESGQAALLGGCIGQAEANFKALVGIIPDIPEFVQEDGQKKSTHDRLIGLLSNFLSTLLILPDNVDSNCKAYVLSGFIKTMERIHWKKTDPLYYNLLLKTLDLLCEMAQEKYTYHIDFVISNDELYGSEEEFIDSIEKCSTNICQELLVVLKLLGNNKESKKQYNLALELFWRVTRRGDLREPAMSSLAYNLWTLSQKLQDSNNKLAKSILRSLEGEKDPAVHQLYEKLTQLYDIRTVHDANYKVFKPEEKDEGENILAALRNDPTVAAYFKPTATNVEVAHPFDYRKEELIDKPDDEKKYKIHTYITGPSRIRRYAGGKKKENLRRNSEEDEDPYNYKAEYISRPKAFDESPYSSAYKEEKNPKNDYEYPYSYDSGYDHKEYERIKELSEKQAAEIKQNPGNCKEVKKDGMTCMSCKDPKTGGNYESCSYVTEPKNNKYAYSKERKFDSNDEPDEPENEQKAERSEKSQKYQDDQKVKEINDSEKPYGDYKKADENDGESPGKYKSYYVHTSAPKPSEALRLADGEENSDENKESHIKPYNYKKALPGFYTDNEPKKDVEHVLAEFKKKDRSACKKVQKNGMTCFQCIDKNGLKHEECMFVSESAPKESHLAYQEVKEFTSKPATLEDGNQPAESQTVTTTAPVQKSASYVVANGGYGKKLKRKKASQGGLVVAAANPVLAAVPDVLSSVQQPVKSHKVKRSEASEPESNAEIVDETNIAPPEEFAGTNSKGAFWAETMPRYSAALGVTLPEYMLSRSEHEALFDEAVAGA
ncbi:unnamed protein product, partial [Iphiclides podalirius]